MPLRHCWVYPVQSPDFLGEEIVVQRSQGLYKPSVRHSNYCLDVCIVLQRDTLKGPLDYARQRSLSHTLYSALAFCLVWGHWEDLRECCLCICGVWPQSSNYWSQEWSFFPNSGHSHLWTPSVVCFFHPFGTQPLPPGCYSSLGWFCIPLTIMCAERGPGLAFVSLCLHRYVNAREWQQH